MNMLTGKTALVTGASSGIGEAMARELAARGANLVLAARRRDRLEALAREIDTEYQSRVAVHVVVIDLAAPGAARRLFDETEGVGQRIDILINNAGTGYNDLFLNIPWERTAQQMQLNMVALTELSYLFGQCMRRRNEGYILNVSSIGAYAPCPYFATYAAGKAYVRNFSEALSAELADTGVRVCCLCPGVTETEFHLNANQELPPAVKWVTMSARRCARIGLDALLSGRRNVISGYLNSLAMFLLRFVPTRLSTALYGFVMGRLVRRLPGPGPTL
ncbi:MAG: SDR family oxidoreductase [Myxococcales bacterium]|nr:SDR family oxidoreductase [Myxococcota bacterium]MDW8281123.1 SDR family oxidoreductase [Myxococcales bacterium]